MENIVKFDLVRVVKQTKSRVSNKAKPGSNYLVTGTYQNPNYGNIKLFLINENCEEFVSTPSCVEKLYNVDSIFKEINGKTKETKWQKVKKDWMSKTYVPVILSHFYHSSGLPMIFSNNGSSALVADIRNAQTNSPNQFWLTKKLVHDDDIRLFASSSLTPDTKKRGEPSSAFSVRVPLWFAKKNKLFN